MPIISTIPKENIDFCCEIFKELQKKCDSCEIFEGKKVDKIFIYKLASDYFTVSGPAMVGIAKYGNIYAINAPKYLSGEQWHILEFLARDTEPEDQLVVFSEEVFNNLKKYSCGESLNVILCV